VTSSRDILFINRYFHPDHSATSQLLSDLAFSLAAEGWSVSVVTSRQLYDAPAAELPERETIDGVEVHRIRTTRFGRARLFTRTLDYLTFHLGVYRHLRSGAGRWRVIVAMTDPPLISTTAALATHRSGPPVIHWIQDLFPEAAEVAGALRGGRLAVGILRRARDLALRRSTNVVVGDDMKQRIAAATANVEVIHNWGLDEAADSSGENLSAGHALVDHFVVGYSGNFGRVHEFGTLLEAARELRDDEAIRFLLVGDGPRRPEIERFLAAHRLSTVTLLPYQPRNRLGAALATSAVHVISLRAGFEGLVVPSKFYGVAAAGKPVLYVGHPAGEIARLVERHECGVVIAPGDVEGLVSAIRLLESDRTNLARMGQNARTAWERLWTRAHAIEQWRELLEREVRGEEGVKGER
jgi:colanic acid biosynthesis glycosyl transferase WcaI